MTLTEDRRPVWSVVVRAVAAGVLAVGLVVTTAPGAAAAPPANDERAAATPVGALPFVDETDTQEATSEPDEPDLCAGAGPTVWYAVRLPRSGSVVLRTAGSAYDTTIAVHVAGPDGPEQVACDDDGGEDLTSVVVLEVVAGRTYLVQVGAYGGGPGGPLRFSAEVAPPPPVVVVGDVSVRALRDGAAVVRATLTCTGTDGVGLEAWVDQRFAGRGLVSGYGYTWVPCADGPTEVLLASSGGVFGGGRASVRVTAWGCDDLGRCPDDAQEATVTVTRRR
ncbi:hypothetical protein [Cellulomonas endophytica]|uniref:hypothetical protein n=1 Tax=Cellulomonas endophytica TaxID=2494735 RepID=UPI001012FF60|nr:hypothetical protein [Cellulomonas endophytica]